MRPVYTSFKLQHGTDEIDTRTHFIRAWTIYLHGPNTDKTDMAANFIIAVLQTERSVNGPMIYNYYNKAYKVLLLIEKVPVKSLFLKQQIF